MAAAATGAGATKSGCIPSDGGMWRGPAIGAGSTLLVGAYPKCLGLGECGLMLAGLDGGPQGIGGGANVGVTRAALSDETSFLGTDFPKVSKIRCLCVAGIDRLATSALLPCNTKRDPVERDSFKGPLLSPRSPKITRPNTMSHSVRQRVQRGLPYQGGGC